MYRIIFEHHIASKDEVIFISEWKASSDMIQKESGALGSRVFKTPINSTSGKLVLYVMADWTNKAARTAAMAAIKARGVVIEGHNVHSKKINIREYEILEESLPTSG